MNTILTRCGCLQKSRDMLQKRMMSYLKAHRKRFYKNVNIHPVEEGYLIQLDGKTIKTPLRHQLCIPKENLALAVANEWHMQTSEINTFSMPLTTICNTSIDNPTDLPKEELVDEILQFLHSDTICSLVEMPGTLVELQDEKWKPVRDWFSQKFDTEVRASSNLFDLHQPDETISKLKTYLMEKNTWQLNGLQNAIDSVKSFILPIAVIHRYISIEEAVYLSRLELEYQIMKWGKFEGTHDIDQHTQETMIAAGSLVHDICKDLS